MTDRATAIITPTMGDTGPTWTVATAQERFEDLVDRAESEGVQVVAEAGQPLVVVVPIGEWAKRTAEPSRPVPPASPCDDPSCPSTRMTP